MKKTILAALTLVSLLTVALFTGCTQEGTIHADATAETGSLVLRVNPEISVQYNQEGLVTRIEGLNDDGTAITAAYDDYIGKDCKTVVKDLVNKIGEAGYFVTDADGNSRTVTLEIMQGSVLPDDDFLEAIAAGIHDTIQDVNPNVQVRVNGDSDYGHTTYDATDYGHTDYSSHADDSNSGYSSQPAPKATTPVKPTPGSGDSDYGVTDYGNSPYDNDSNDAAAAPAPVPTASPAPPAAPPADNGDSGYSNYDDGGYSDYDDTGYSNYDDTGYSDYSDSGYSDYGDSGYDD